MNLNYRFSDVIGIVLCIGHPQWQGDESVNHGLGARKILGMITRFGIFDFRAFLVPEPTNVKQNSNIVMDCDHIYSTVLHIEIMKDVNLSGSSA